MIELNKNQDLMHIVHCAATPNFKEFTAKDVHRWHTDPKPKGNGWDDTGYHFIIELDGNIVPCRSLKYAGAHCRGYNTKSIGTCLIGTDKFTDAQMKSLVLLDRYLKNVYNIKSTHGHNEFSTKKCPGFDVKKLMEVLSWT